MTKRYFIHTFGCQMNVNDTNRMGEALASACSYKPTPVAENADLIILNTCSIREKAEEKMLSALGRYRQVKLQRGALIGVGGCVAQQEKEKLLEQVPYVDFVFGPDAIGKLPEILERVRARPGAGGGDGLGRQRGLRLPPGRPRDARAARCTEFVTVMKGCDNVCAFCVVPHTRGREVSRALRRGARRGRPPDAGGRARGDAGRPERQQLPRRASPSPQLLLRTAAGPGHRAGALHHQPPARPLGRADRGLPRSSRS